MELTSNQKASIRSLVLERMLEDHISDIAVWAGEELAEVLGDDDIQVSLSALEESAIAYLESLLRVEKTKPEILKNGALVIESKSKGRDDEYRVVLARWHPTIDQDPNEFQYVTWVVDPDGNAFWGHYFPNLEEALQDYQDRN